MTRTAVIKWLAHTFRGEGRGRAKSHRDLQLRSKVNLSRAKLEAEPRSPSLSAMSLYS